MPQVELDLDVVAMLRLEARRDGDDLSACLRRLISEVNKKKAGKRMSLDQVSVPRELDPEKLATLYPSAILRFMVLLAWLSRKHGNEFAMVEQVSGRGRLYFSKDPQAILRTGASTAPKKIPESDYWVCTNLSNKMKEQILDGVLTVLGYSPRDRRAWAEAAAGEDDGSGEEFGDRKVGERFDRNDPQI